MYEPTLQSADKLGSSPQIPERRASRRHPCHQVIPYRLLTAKDLTHTNRLVEKLLDTLLEGFVLPHTKTTVLQDWIKGRHSEVNELNGLVVAERARRGVASPVNAAVAAIAHRIERGDLKPGPQNLPLLTELAFARGA